MEIGIGDIIRFPPSPGKKMSKRVEIGVGDHERAEVNQQQQTTRLVGWSADKNR